MALKREGTNLRLPQEIKNKSINRILYLINKALQRCGRNPSKKLIGHYWNSYSGINMKIFFRYFRVNP